MEDFFPPEDLTTRTIQSQPHNRQAEEAILGSILINPTSFYDIALILSADNFYIIRNRWIWEVFSYLLDKKKPIDLITVSDELDNRGQLEEIGGQGYVINLINCTPSSANAISYAEIVRDLYRRRNVLATANEMVKIAYDQANDLDMEIAKCAGRVLEAKKTNRAKNAVDVGLEFANEFASDVDSLSSGIPSLDQAVGNFLRGEMSILAARTSVGKTAVSWQIARNVASSGKRVLYISTESSRTHLWARACCGALRIDMRRLRMNLLSKEEREAIEDMSAKLMNRYTDNLWIDDESATLEEMHESIYSKKPDWVFLDHLNELALPDKYETKRDYLGEVARYLRRLSKIYLFHFMCNHQLDRGVDKRPDHEPQLADLRWSGDLEEKTDIAIFLHRRDMYDTDTRKSSTVDMEAWIKKNRMGSANVLVNLEFDMRSQWVTPLKNT